ncbi:MAG: sulfurtransferase TusA family protein [Anaerolineae bacterium]|nr:sulfurtransferase TusA family protein [Anaerolineae bacterium]MDQ7035196.1 sulfurtransferase TusA family protein [Anaerolineae bacterium]
MSEQTYEISTTLDVTGLMCPMPLVKARKAIMDLEVGQVIEVLATDKGSIKDFQGWAKVAKNVELLAQNEKEGGDTTIYAHVVKRTK